MDPLVLWIEHHRRDQWQSPATRASYEAVHGAVSQAEWQSALGRVYARERVETALENAHGNATIGTALRGVLAFGDTVNIRVVVYGTDVAGHSVSFAMDVLMARTDRVRDIIAAVFDAAAASQYGQTVQVDDWEYLPGSYA